VQWDEASGQWKLKVDQKGVIKEDFADILVDGSGALKWVIFTARC
jgi:hypothetical protein